MYSLRAVVTWLLTLYSLFGVSELKAEYGDWKAKVIDVSGKQPSSSYLEGYTWNFTEGGSEISSEWSGVEELKVSGSRLEFVTNGITQLDLGGLALNQISNKNPKVLIELSQQAWPWAVQVKLSQSKNRSEWTLETEHRLHGRKKITKKKAVLIGQGEQIMQFNMAPIRKFAPYEFHLTTNTGGNRISIEWVRIVRPTLNKVFRYSFKLPEEPLASKLAFAANGRISVYINGERIGQHGARHPFSRRLNIYDNIAQLKQGDNTLCVSIEGYTAFSRLGNPGKQFFLMEGGVIGESGKYKIIKTDDEWQGRYVQDNCAISDHSGKSVRVKGPVRNTWLVLGGVKAHEKLGDAPYIGRVNLRYKDTHPIYFEDEAVVVEVDVLGKKKVAGTNVDYALTEWSDDKRDKKAVIVSGKVSAVEKVINLGKLSPGVYELTVSIRMKGNPVDERRQELVVVGRIDQKIVDKTHLKSNLELNQVDAIAFQQGIKRRILCANKDGTGVKWFGTSGNDVSSIGSLTGARLSGDYLELPAQRSAWCSIEYRVGELDKPHLIEIEYPRDGIRSMIFNVAEESTYKNLTNIGHGGGVSRLSSGVYTANGVGSGVARYIYWPNSRRATLNIVNAGQARKDRGAISKVTVYEITNGLPRYHLPSATDKYVQIGPFVERIDRTTPYLFYQGNLGAKFSSDLSSGYFPGYYNAWYRTISNLIKYLGFSGQNTYYAGIYMYYGGWFASESFQGKAENAANEYAAGWDNGAIPLLAKMFESNDLDLVLGVQFIGSRKLIETDIPNDEAVNEGGKTIRFVNKYGHQSRGFQNQGYNFLHAEVRQEILKLTDEIGKKFSKYKAIKGVTWMRLPEYPWDAETIYNKSSQLDLGYGDTTIALYKDETASKLPMWRDDHQRFEKRYKWLLANEKEEWISWRCKKVYDTDKQISARLKKYRSDWQLWRLVSRPAPKLVAYWSKGRIDFRDVYRYGGIDPLLYRGNSDIHLMVLMDVGAEKKYEKRGQLAGLSYEIRSFYGSKQFNDLFKNTDTFVHTGFMLESRLTNKEEWNWKKLTIVGYSVPDKGGLYPFLIKSGESLNARAIAVGWSDVGHFIGSEDDIRRFGGTRYHREN